MISDIEQLIDEHSLRKKKRKRSMVYKRYYLFNHLRRKHYMTYYDIGAIFDLDHSTILYGIRQHERWMDTKDSVYIKAVAPLMEALDNIPMEREVDTYEVHYKGTVGDKIQLKITGNFPTKLLTNFYKPLTGAELSDIFAMS